ncbi:MAG: hypothetical protein M3P26_17985 [Gemmatimonadota bacterium]|nr:hypothetical protein [Gemmatimonadota bacterium]
MSIRAVACLAALSVLCPARELSAQKHVPDDSLGVMVDVESRLLWRDISLADAPGLHSGIAIPLSRLPMPLQLELDGWTALADRPLAGLGDQYSAALHYQWILADRPHPKSFVLGYAEYWNPNLRGLSPPRTRGTRELSVSGLFDIGIPQQGIRTVHLRLDAARDLARENATWVQGAANASAGTTVQCTDTFYSLSAILKAALSASDLRGPRMPGSRPAFGFHSADFGIDFQIRGQLPIVTVDATTAFQFGTSIRADRLGPNVGWVGLQLSFLFL